MTTSGSNNLTLHARTGAIGAVGQPVGATAGGTLNLVSDPSSGAGFVVASSHALTLGQNIVWTIGSGRNTIGVGTTAGDVTVPTGFVLPNDDLVLIAAGNVNLPNGTALSVPSLELIAGAALNIGPTTTLTTTAGSMTLGSGTTDVDSAAQPLRVQVTGGVLSLVSAGSLNFFITSPTALGLGAVNLGPTGVANIATTAGGITLVSGNTTNAGTVSLTAAGSVALNNPGSFQAGSLTITAQGSISGGGNLATTLGGVLTLTANGGGLGTSGTP